MITEVYDVRALIDPDLGMLSEDELIELVTSAVSPQSWAAHSGPGSQTVFRGLLVVSQSDDVLLQIERLLTALIEHCRPGSKKRATGDVVLVETSPAAERIERVLAQPVSVDYCGWPLEDLLRDLARRHDLPLVVEKRWAPDRIDFRTCVSITAADRTLESVLNEILNPLGLRHLVHQHVLLVTSDEFRWYQELRLYRVDDLARAGDREAIGILADRIRTALDPRYWDERGGPGLVHVLSSGWILVSADWQKHQELADWLAEQRTGQPTQRARERAELQQLLYEVERFRNATELLGAP
jgi:hypothetical protein